MKKLLLSSVALLGLTVAATAADLPRRVAPAPYVPVAPAFTWTGFYIGVNAGYGWSNRNDDPCLDGAFGFQATQYGIEGTAADRGEAEFGDPLGERVREPRHGMRRLEHLAGVQRVEVGEVVAEPLRRLEQHGLGVLAEPRPDGRREVPESAVE